jgi:hypothetical protein
VLVLVAVQLAVAQITGAFLVVPHQQQLQPKEIQVVEQVAVLTVQLMALLQVLVEMESLAAAEDMQAVQVQQPTQVATAVQA